MQLSVFTPLPPAPTGIADYSALLLRELARARDTFEVEAFTEGEADPQPFPVHPPRAFSAGDALPMYHVGNSEHHDFVYPFLFREPGVLVLHDLVLHHARLRSYLDSPECRAYKTDMGDPEKRLRAEAQLDAYRDEVRKAYPDEGEAIAEIAIHSGGGRLLYDYPLYENLVRGSRLTLVHNQTALEEVRARCPDAPVRRVRMGMPLVEKTDRATARQRLGLGDELLLASFGLVTPEKRISTALRAFARLRSAGVSAKYLLVGGLATHYDPLAEARELGIENDVHALGRVSDEDFWLYALASDLCLNLRYPTAGETSATLLRLLACGRAVVVTDQLQVADFPQDVVARSSVEGEEHGLYCDLMDLVRSEDRRRDLENASRRFVAEEHSPQRMVADYSEALASMAGT